MIGGQWPVGIRVERLKPGFEGTEKLAKPLKQAQDLVHGSTMDMASSKSLLEQTPRAHKMSLPKPKCQPIQTIPLPSCNLACEMGMPNMAQKARTRQKKRTMTSSSWTKRKSST